MNPYAAAYVPLSKREGSLVDTKPVTQQHMQQQHHQQQPYYGYGVQGMGSYQGTQMSPKKSPSEMVYNHQLKDEDLEMDMDIEYLLATYPGLSQESINDVYLANTCDLDATIEMLNQLEIYSTEAEEYLPDTLDIGDVPEIITESSKQKNDGSSASSSSGIRNANVSSS